MQNIFVSVLTVSNAYISAGSKTKEEWKVEVSRSKSVFGRWHGCENGGFNVDTKPWSVTEKPPSPTKAKT